MFCLVPDQADAFIEAIKSGRIDPDALSKMTSEERNYHLGQFVGDNNAKAVNALFESKLLLKNQQRGMITWAKQVSGITPKVRRDLLAKIERMQPLLDPGEHQQFMRDLTSTRLGIDVTQDEARNIADLSKNLTEAESKAKPDHTFPTEDNRFAYGAAKVNLENYVNDLKLQSKKLKFVKNPVLKTKDTIGATPGVLKSIVASLDDSFFGRQGIKTLLDLRTSHIWVKNFAKSFVDIAKELGGKDAMNATKADLYSRPNALNGKYRAGKYGLDVLSEEAYPSALPEKIPLLGRLFKASESAYNGGALRMRGDLADRYIKIAEKQGINTLDKTEAEGLGTLIGGITGRGNLGLTEKQAQGANALLFSIKFLKANFDTLTGHLLDSKATKFTKVEAAKNLASMVTSVAGILTVAHQLDPKSVDLDPRSPNFGKVKLSGHWTDITGGMGAMTTLAARLVPTQHNGKWGLYSKSKTGVYTNETNGGFGAQTALDTANNFWEGKLSPAAGIVRDLWTGKDYSGHKPTAANELGNVGVPISIQTFNQLKDSNNADKLGSMIADGLGFSVSTNPVAPTQTWNNSTSSALQSFKAKVGQQKFDEANKKYDAQLKESLDGLYANPDFVKESDTDKQRSITKRKAEAQKEVLQQYGFKYKAPKKKKAV